MTNGEYYNTLWAQRDLDRIKAHIIAEKIWDFQQTELAEFILTSEDIEMLDRIRARMYEISKMEPTH